MDNTHLFTSGSDKAKDTRAVKNSVLIVDDVKSNIDILKIMLEHDYIIYSALNGKTAIEIADNQSPDLILLDILMPGLNGFDVLKILKSSEKTKNIPVIIISGLEDAQGEEKGLDLGAADFIHRPFNDKIVKIKVRHQLQIVNQIRTIEQYVREEQLTISKMLVLQNDLEMSMENALNANKAKSTFLARMSHEIRTPINAVIGISEMQLSSQNLSPDAREAFVRINNSGDLLLGIVNDILDISRIEAGKLELTQEKYNVCTMINDAVYLNTIKHEEKPIEFILNVDENVPMYVSGDEIRIKQILNNLLSNAFKYTLSGEVELSLNAEKSGGNKKNKDEIILVFRVRDTGQGMTEEQLGKIFDEYSRFNLDINKATVGAGLGMGITKNLIRMMQGEIFAESKKDSGSLFTVRIPQGNVNAPAIGKEAAEKLRQFRTNFKVNVKKNQITREPIPFARILIVDDIDMNLYVTRGLLSPYGVQTDTAISGFEAIEKIKKSHESNNLYDLIFMDHIMPVMDGIETTKRIREMGAEYEKLPVIMLTANAFTITKDSLLSNGFNGLLLKPVNIQELDAVLKEWVSVKKIKKPESLKQEETESSETLNLFFRALGNIEEINIETGLNHVAGKRDTYRDTLEIFHGKLEAECNKMSYHLDNKDLHNFLISIHSMKTMLVIIGASSLSEAAHALQLASSNHDINYCRHRFLPFRNKMSLLHDKLDCLFGVSHKSAAHLAQKDNKILIVEDVEMILNILKLEFEKYDLFIDTATCGPEAIEKTIKNNYNIIFMDYRMPEMDGIITTERIRKLEAKAKIKQNIIIALTSDIDPIKEKMFIENGFDGVLSKPIKKQDLEKILKLYCKSLIF